MDSTTSFDALHPWKWRGYHHLCREEACSWLRCDLRPTWLLADASCCLIASRRRVSIFLCLPQIFWGSRRWWLRPWPLAIKSMFRLTPWTDWHSLDGRERNADTLMRWEFNLAALHYFATCVSTFLAAASQLIELTLWECYDGWSPLLLKFSDLFTSLGRLGAHHTASDHSKLHFRTSRPLGGNKSSPPRPPESSLRLT